MLVLTRRNGERLRIGDGPDAVWVGVIEGRDGRAKLSIVAPTKVLVLREELIPQPRRAERRKEVA